MTTGTNKQGRTDQSAAASSEEGDLSTSLYELSCTGSPWRFDSEPC